MDDERITNMIAGQFFVNPVAAYVMLFGTNEYCQDLI
jgi:hypothetical protein